MARIAHLETENTNQWKEMRDIKTKQNKIYDRINYALVGIVFALIGILANFLK